MLAMPPPVAHERHALRDYLYQQQYAYHALAYGLTDDQARATPTVSALSIGALIKHATGVQRMWMQRVDSAPAAPPADERPVDERQADYADEFLMRDYETLLASILRGNWCGLGLMPSYGAGQWIWCGGVVGRPRVAGWGGLSWGRWVFPGRLVR